MRHDTAPEPTIGEHFSSAALAKHLNIDPRTLPEVERRTGLAPASKGSYPVTRVLHRVHNVDPALLPAYLAQLRKSRPTSECLGKVDDLARTLLDPLCSFAELAHMLATIPDTLSKRIRRGSFAIPIPTIDLGPRLRMFRPLEIRLWRDEELILDLPEAPSWIHDAPRPDIGGEDQGSGRSPKRRRVSPAAAMEVGPGSGCGSCRQEDRRKAIFGAFGANSRTGSE